MAVVQQLGGISFVKGSNSFNGCKLIGSGKLNLKRKDHGGIVRVQAVKTEKTEADVLPSGEWPENFSMLNFEDLSVHFAPTLFKAEAQPSTLLADVMSALRFSAAEDTLLKDVEGYFAEVSGIPVLDKDHNCIGILSRKDLEKSSNGLESKVLEVMSSPAITLTADKTVSDAAVIMLKKKIHRIPIVNDCNQVIGMVTRTDIFTALEGK